VKWFKRQPKEGFSYDQVVSLLIKLTGDVVKDTSQTLEKHLNAAERSKLPKVQEELFFFFVFALDYWWQIERAHTQDEKRIWGEIFGAHLRILLGGDPEGLAMFDTLQQRLIAYAEIVTEAKGDTAMFTGFGMKLSEFCGMPNVLFLVLAPELFTKALEAVLSFRRER